MIIDSQASVGVWALWIGGFIWYLIPQGIKYPPALLWQILMAALRLNLMPTCWSFDEWSLTVVASVARCTVITCINYLLMTYDQCSSNKDKGAIIRSFCDYAVQDTLLRQPKRLLPRSPWSRDFKAALRWWLTGSDVCVRTRFDCWGVGYDNFPQDVRFVTQVR